MLTLPLNQHSHRLLITTKIVLATALLSVVSGCASVYQAGNSASSESVTDGQEVVALDSNSNQGDSDNTVAITAGNASVDSSDTTPGDYHQLPALPEDVPEYIRNTPDYDASGLSMLVSRLMEIRFGVEYPEAYLKQVFKQRGNTRRTAVAERYTLLDVKRSVESLGYRTVAFRIESEDPVNELREHQQLMKDGPYLLIPNDNYARFFLFMDADEENAYLHDPAYGRVAITHAEFMKTFTPLLFVIQGKASEYMVL